MKDMNDPLETGHFTDNQMERFINSICSWDACRNAVAAPAVILVKPESLYCRTHLADLTAYHAVPEWERYP
jgi:hypothetical protein